MRSDAVNGFEVNEGEWEASSVQGEGGRIDALDNFEEKLPMRSAHGRYFGIQLGRQAHISSGRPIHQIFLDLPLLDLIRSIPLVHHREYDTSRCTSYTAIFLFHACPIRHI